MTTPTTMTTSMTTTATTMMTNVVVSPSLERLLVGCMLLLTGATCQRMSHGWKTKHKAQKHVNLLNTLCYMVTYCIASSYTQDHSVWGCFFNDLSEITNSNKNKQTNKQTNKQPNKQSLGTCMIVSARLVYKKHKNPNNQILH